MRATQSIQRKNIQRYWQSGWLLTGYGPQHIGDENFHEGLVEGIISLLDKLLNLRHLGQLVQLLLRELLL